MNRQEAYEHLTARLTNRNLIKHSVAVEAIMKELARHFSEDEALWGLAGLLHDIDLDQVQNDMARHGLAGAEMLERLGLDEAVVYAVKAHNSHHGIERRRKMDKALFCADPMSGLITACVLILPSKSLEDVHEAFIVKRFHEKSFARGASRGQIMECEALGLDLSTFAGIALNAMKQVRQELGF